MRYIYMRYIEDILSDIIFRFIYSNIFNSLCYIEEKDIL